MGWQKRGNGHSYDSSSGHSTLVGEISGRVMDYEVKRKICYRCSRKGAWCLRKSCRRNWTGSAKSMEAASAVRMVTESVPLETAQVKIGTLIGDEDSSTAAAIRRAVGGALIQGSDIQHVAKNVKKHLYLSKNLHPKLTPSVIKFIVKLVGCAIKQNKGKADEIANALNSIPEHLFNNHTSCGEWCSYAKDPSSYKSKYLKTSLGEHGCDLYKAICQELANLIKKSKQLAPCGSTQKNESVNNIIGSKALKIRHYGGSESLNYRVAAGVNQTNIGPSYVLAVNRQLKISPGIHAKRYKQQLERKRQREAEENKKPENKKRRRLLIDNKYQNLVSLEREEGVTYRSGVGFEDPAPLETETATETALVGRPAEKKKSIPVYSSPISKLPPVTQTDVTLLYFDVETTGLDALKNEIIQISAHSQEHGTFNRYIKPSSYLPLRITQVTSLSMKKGKLMYKNQVVEVVTKKEALVDFLAFAKKHQNALLVAHNAQFDLRFLLYNIKVHGLNNELLDAVIGAVDTLPLLRKKYPKKNNSIDNHQLETLVKFVLGNEYVFESHNSIADCKALKDMMEKLLYTAECLREKSFTMQSFKNRGEEILRFKTLLVLTDHGVAPPQLSQLARTNWSLSKLLTAVFEGDEENLARLLQQDLKSYNTSVAKSVFQYASVPQEQ